MGHFLSPKCQKSENQVQILVDGCTFESLNFLLTFTWSASFNFHFNAKVILSLPFTHSKVLETSFKRGDCIDLRDVLLKIVVCHFFPHFLRQAIDCFILYNTQYIQHCVCSCICTTMIMGLTFVSCMYCTLDALMFL